jgi:hypothetical protein
MCFFFDKSLYLLIPATQTFMIYSYAVYNLFIVEVQKVWINMVVFHLFRIVVSPVQSRLGEEEI